jgi:hypothetical protein
MPLTHPWTEAYGNNTPNCVYDYQNHRDANQWANFAYPDPTEMAWAINQIV